MTFCCIVCLLHEVVVIVGTDGESSGVDAEGGHSLLMLTKNLLTTTHHPNPPIHTPYTLPPFCPYHIFTNSNLLPFQFLLTPRPPSSPTLIDIDKERSPRRVAWERGSISDITSSKSDCDCMWCDACGIYLLLKVYVDCRQVCGVGLSSLCVVEMFYIIKISCTKFSPFSTIFFCLFFLSLLILPFYPPLLFLVLFFFWNQFPPNNCIIVDCYFNVKFHIFIISIFFIYSQSIAHLILIDKNVYRLVWCLYFWIYGKLCKKVYTSSFSHFC